MSSENEEAESESGKWAAEAFGFLRFYQRVGNQLWGLILMEIGWAALVFLISKMVGEKGENKIHHVAIIDIFLVGSLIVALCWCLSSGVYLYAYLVLKRIAMGIATFLLFTAVGLLVIIEGVFKYGAFKRIERRLRLKEEAKTNRLAKTTDEKPLVKPEIETALRKRLTQEAQQKRDESRTSKAWKWADWIAKQPGAPWPLRVARVFDRTGKICVFGLRWLKSGGRIALAPIYSFTFEEDRNAAKAPLQAFAAGVDRLQNRLSRLPSIQLIQFEVLPVALNVMTARRAKTLRWLFGFDAVLWGSYISTQPPKIAVQIDTARPRTEDEESAWDRTWRSLDLFSRLDEVENEGIIVDQEDALDAYVGISMALVHALHARSFRRRGALFAPLDKLGFYNRSDRLAIVTEVVKDGLFALPAAPLRSPAKSEDVTEYIGTPYPSRSNFTSSPTAKEVLIDLAGKWLGDQLSGLTLEDERYPPEFLEDVALRSTELRPADAENYYRLAAIRLLLGKTAEARTAIEAACAHNSRTRRIATSPILVQAQMAIEDRLSFGERDLKEAKCAVYVARAVARGGDKIRTRLIEEFKKTDLYRTRRLEALANEVRNEKGEKFEMQLLSPAGTILFESLALNDPVAEKAHPAGNHAIRE